MTRDHRNLGVRILGATLLPVVLLSTGCITGNEAEESLEPSRSQQLADLERAHDIGIISDVEYNANRQALLGQN